MLRGGVVTRPNGRRRYRRLASLPIDLSLINVRSVLSGGSHYLTFDSSYVSIVSWTLSFGVVYAFQYSRAPHNEYDLRRARLVRAVIFVVTVLSGAGTSWVTGQPAVFIHRAFRERLKGQKPNVISNWGRKTSIQKTGQPAIAGWPPGPVRPCVL